MLTWEKRGLVIRPQPDFRWWRTHAMVPVPEPVAGGVFRVYFSGRDEQNRSHIASVVLDLDRPDKLLDVSREPVLSPGELGCFDDNGVTPSCVARVGERKFLYYIGWNPGSTVRVHLFGGLAVSDDDGRRFTRYSRAPILERTAVDPFLNTAPFVVPEHSGWRMYYVAGVGWTHRDLPRYHIRTATSHDGIAWKRDGQVCIDFAVPEETALARPWVVREDGIYRMWFAYKRETYRIGYAESRDGVEWQRDDAAAGLSVSESGWDSDMVEYAAVVNHGGRHYMFYNGNQYGYDGIGLAVEK
jgi:predicted GH43/DUF377 family glycosyl hydrolase